MADMLSREERKDRETPAAEPDVYLVTGDVEGQPPQEIEEKGEEWQEPWEVPEREPARGVPGLNNELF